MPWILDEFFQTLKKSFIRCTWRKRNSQLEWELIVEGMYLQPFKNTLCKNYLVKTTYSFKNYVLY